MGMCPCFGGNTAAVEPKHRDRFRCFFDMKAEDTPLGRIVFELRGDVVPITAENFRQFCTGEAANSFRGTKFHRVIPGFICQGGDYAMGDGTGGKSIYGRRFPDENFTLRHEKCGDLSMANGGKKDSNGSQFFISLAPNPTLDGKHVVFGHLLEGEEVLKALEGYGTTSGRPKKRLYIASCGEC